MINEGYSSDNFEDQNEKAYHCKKIIEEDNKEEEEDDVSKKIDVPDEPDDLDYEKDDLVAAIAKDEL